jgi:hypothetical protein
VARARERGRRRRWAAGGVGSAGAGSGAGEPEAGRRQRGSRSGGRSVRLGSTWSCGSAGAGHARCKRSAVRATARGRSGALGERPERRRARCGRAGARGLGGARERASAGAELARRKHAVQEEQSGSRQRCAGAGSKWALERRLVGRRRPASGSTTAHKEEGEKGAAVMVSAREQLKRILGCPKKRVVPGIGRCLVGGGVAQAHGGAADVELRCTRLEHVQMRRGKAEANAGLATGEGEAVQDAVGWMLRWCVEQRCAGAARQGRGERGSSR